jgi:CelD/BcsL family acetyltransferase involved in cellulose biosynthesis
MEFTPSSVTVSLLSPDQAALDTELRPHWDAFLALVHPLNRFYASPDWFFHRWRVYRRETFLAVMRDGEQHVIGVCPLDSYPIELRYGVKKWNFGTVSFQASVVMGSEPMLPPETALFDRLVDGVFRGMNRCSCIALDAVPHDSFTWDYFQGQGRLSRNYYAYDPTAELRNWYYIELGKTFDDYLKTLKSRSRSNINNKARRFRKNCGGTIDLERIQTKEGVDRFYEAACLIAERSWRYRTIGRESGHPTLVLESLSDLAQSKLLRAYLLTLNQDPIAYVVGYQYRGVFQSAETAYIEELSPIGPGAFLLYMLLQDLHQYDPPQFLNFGVGEGDYKRGYSNRSSSDSTIYLFRRTLVNRLHCMSHGAFRSGRLLAKRIFRRRAASTVQAEPCQRQDTC